MPVEVGKRYRDRYEVVERIGEGAFATVYRARDPEGREVALKVLKESYVGVPDVVERFQREVFAVASISSPHVVALSDFGISDEDFYMVMELMRGPSLRELMRARPWSRDDIHLIVGQIAHALSAAHRQEIVHRDLKPENVMLIERAQGWQVKVLDFGFAKLAELERKLELQPITRVGFCFGTPQYLSPEQIRGRPLDGGADLFALGVIAYEMLAERRPWDGDDPREVMHAVLKSPPPAVTRLHPSLIGRIGEVNAFLDRALAKERKDRPADAAAFFAELGQALYGDALPELLGASPAAPLDSVSSRSIELQLGARERGDATLVNPPEDDRKTIPFVTAYDTARQPAMDSSKVIVDGGSDIPIFVEPRDRRLPSGWFAAPDASAASGGTRRDPRAHDSQRATLPRAVRERGPRTSVARVLALLIVIAAVAAAAFWLGRYAR